MAFRDRGNRDAVEGTGANARYVVVWHDGSETALKEKEVRKYQAHGQ